MLRCNTLISPTVLYKTKYRKISSYSVHQTKRQSISIFANDFIPDKRLKDSLMLL